MKKFLLLFAVVAFVAVSASAQSTQTKTSCTKSKTACTKSKTACTKSKTACTKSKTVNAELPACPTKAAAVLASNDKSISAKTCSQSGKVSYYKTSTCATSGKVSMKEVKFCGESKSFVNVAPTKNTFEAKSVSTGKTLEKKSCAKKCTKGKSSCSKAKAKQVSLEK